MVEPAPPREFVIWPMHITIVPWFPVDDEAKLDEVLEKVASKHEAFDVAIGRTQDWGKKDKFKVTLIDDPGNLHRLHWDIFHSLDKNGFRVHQKDHLGASYKPHITKRNRKSHDLPEGETIPVISILLIKQLRQKKTGTMIKEVAKEYFLQ
ncbi:MAG TPA: 2'-5' RNA ligase family protein [Candidatus Saccharimonadales bacterium]